MRRSVAQEGLSAQPALALPVSPSPSPSPSVELSVIITWREGRQEMQRRCEEDGNKGHDEVQGFRQRYDMQTGEAGMLMAQCKGCE